MKIKIFSIGKDRNKILWWIILTGLMVATILIAISIYLITLNKKEIVIEKKDDIFNVNSYNAEYNITVVSNKTTNKYHMKEEYKKEVTENNENAQENEFFKFVTSNEIGDTITYEITNNSLKISSSNEINNYILSDYLMKKRNIFSFSTFSSIYNDINLLNEDSSKNSCAKITTEEFDNKTLYRMTFKKDCNCEICTKYKELFRAGIQITKLELVISNETNMPIEYVVYNKDNMAYIDISYENFQLK